jgi:hypothetical protein
MQISYQIVAELMYAIDMTSHNCVDTKSCVFGCVGTYPPVKISKDMLYVILLSCGSRRMDSGALDHDLEIIYLLESNRHFLWKHINCPLNCVHST